MYDRAVALSVLLLASPAFAQDAAPPADAAQRARILSEIQELRGRLESLEAELGRTPGQAAPAPAATAAAPAAEPTIAAQKPANSGNHTMELYGFAQADVVQDFDRVDPSWDATLRPSKIPTTKGQFGSDGQSIVSVRQSRLGAVARGELGGKDYEAKFEFDLYGVGVDAGQTTFRLRHAYGRWGPILAGQTNSLFMDGDLFPNTIDYWGPTGMVFVRTPQLRYTFVNNGGWTVAAALELPSNDIDAGALRLIDPDLATNIKGDEELPDLTAMVRYDGDWGHVQLSGIARKVGFDTVGTVDNEPTGSEFGWGLMLGTVFKWELATFRIGGVYGQGIASYMNDGGMDLAPKAELVPAPPPLPPLNQLLEAKAVPLWGVTAYVDLQWTPQLSSSFGYSRTEVDNTNFQTGDSYHAGDYASGNLLWSPVDRVLTGAEFLWGKRTDNDGDSGEDKRLQFTVKVSFSSKDVWGQ
ncbi:hypothetical protein ACFB49_38210 [Sphingomonas sp. DBB INV C78]|uniref:DcaP family trimeric outer membrane transporter n=1 Tax=Sphingomonas sp. DBB INV C78 TaxID=3349434 RepID=UPI0036D4010D